MTAPQTASTAALPHLTCPLCGGPNACAPACSGSLDTPCWCRQASFSPDLMARVPPEQRNQACICAACASASRTDLDRQSDRVTLAPVQPAD